MLFSKLDLNEPNVYKKFEFRQADHKSSWEHYYKVYSKTFFSVIEKGLGKNYAFNSSGHALIFLLRHVLELNLKYNLSLSGKQIPLVHTFADLINAFAEPSIVPDAFKQAAQVFMSDDDGSTWRYWADFSGAPFFENAEKMELAPVLEKLNSLPSMGAFQILPVSPQFDYEKSTITWSMTLHVGQCNNDWHIKGEFDDLVDTLIEMIYGGEVELKDAYLPLMFFIRHAIELALKGNIGAIQPVSNDISQKDIRPEHSLSVLYNVFKGYLDKVNWSLLADNTREQYYDYRRKYDHLNEALHNLDTHSRAFRYPFDKEGNPQPLNLTRAKIVEIIKLYQLTDPFITFTTNVLIDNNMLPFDPDIHG